MHPDESDEQQLTMTLEQKSLGELSMYLSEPEVTEYLLLWWKMNSFPYPIFLNWRKKYLPIPATSVPSERAFSTAGTKKRAYLQPSSVNMLVFLSENLP